VNESGSGSCPTVSLGLSSAENLDSTTTLTFHIGPMKNYPI
jgi:hypothetical protein